MNNNPDPVATDNQEAYLAMLNGVDGLAMPEIICDNKEYYLRQLVLNSMGGTSSGAHNSISRGKDLTNVYSGSTTAEVLANMSADIQAGKFRGYVGDYITMNVKVGSNATEELDFVVAGIDTFLHTGDTELNAHHIVLVPDTGFKETMKMNDSNTTTGGYYGSLGHGICSVAYTAGTGGSLTNPLGDYTKFQASDLGETGTYEFVYNGTKWQYGGADKTLSNYGLSYTGTPVEGDTLTVSFTTGYLEPFRQAIYTAFGNDHILTFRDYQMTGTDSAAWHDARVELMNESMVYGARVWAQNARNEMGRPFQLPLFAHEPNRRVTMKGKGGARSGAWLCSASSGSYFCFISSSGFARYDAASSSLAVRPFFLFA